MSKPVVSPSTKYSKSLSRYDRLRKKSETLFNESRVNKSEIENIYAVLFVQSVALFESTLEEIFIGLVTGKLKSATAKINPKISIRHADSARKVLYGVAPYFNWLPYERNTEKISKVYFEDTANPFTFKHTDKKLLETIGLIRNAIAHNSQHSLSYFKTKVTADKRLPPREKKIPASFLRSPHIGSQTRYEYYSIELRRMLNSICA